MNDHGRQSLTADELALLEAQRKATPLPWRATFVYDHAILSTDAAYIVAAANAVPGLLSEIARLRGERDEARDAASFEHAHVIALQNEINEVEDERDALRRWVGSAISVALWPPNCSMLDEARTLLSSSPASNRLLVMSATQVLCSNCGQPWGARRWTKVEMDAEPRNSTSTHAAPASEEEPK